MPRPAALTGSARLDDSHAELSALATEIRDAVLDVVWRQWRALGASAVTTSPVSRARRAEPTARRDLQALIDPEALVLISLVLMRDERRLADLLHDWAARNADLLSVQRTKNLAASYPEPVRDALDRGLVWFARVAQDTGKDLRWRSVTQVAGHHESSAGGTSPATRGDDDRYAKPRAVRARLTTDASLLLRLRLGIGVGVKADVLAFLLARADAWATVREIADATAYTLVAVRRAADDLAAARLVYVREGQPTSYRGAVESWAPLLALGGPVPQWASWHERFAFAAAFLHWADAARERPLSRYALGALGRELLERYRPVFQRDQIAEWSAHSPIADWATFLDQTVRSLASWMREMA